MSNKENYVNPAFSLNERKQEKYNAKEHEKNEKDLKTTVISGFHDNGSAGVRKKTEKVKEAECNDFHIVLAVVFFSITIAFFVILAFYIKEKRDVDSPPENSSKTCFDEKCISSAAAFRSDDQKLPRNHHGKDSESIKMIRKNTVISLLDTSGLVVVRKNTKRHIKTECDGFNVTLTVVLVSVIVAFAVIVALYVKEIREFDSPSTSHKRCFEEECISIAADLLRSMNRSVDPCEDFYSFACGGWQQKTLIPTSETEVHVLWSLTNTNRQFLRNLLGYPATREKYSQNRAVIKSMDFYQICLSKSTINQQDDTYLKDVIKSFGGSNLTTVNWNSSEYDLLKVIQMAFGELGVQPFFSLNVFVDFINSSIRRFGISEGGIVLANTFYVEKNSSETFYSKTRDAYRQYMVDVMTLFGADQQEARRQMLQVFLFEEKIAELIKKNQGAPGMATLKSLSNYTNFDWFKFLTALTANQTYNLTEEEVVLVRTKDLLKDVMALINDTDKAILSNYIAWTVIEKVIDHLPGKYAEARVTYNKRIHGETYDVQERWITCFEATKKAFPMAIGLIFVDEKLSSQARGRAREIFEEIKSEFLRELSIQTWMDQSTRTKAKEKAEATTLVVGYPDYIKDEERLNEKYKNFLVDKSNYLKTVFNIRKFSFQDKVSVLKRPADRNGFEYSPADVNAHYYHQQNNIVFLAGILLSPFYDEQKLRASNYGGIGMVAGHELIHGFDQNGRLYDKYGNRANWWTKTSAEKYVNKSQCLVKQYGELELYGKKVNGYSTLGENIADNGGLKLAFEAYKHWVEKNGEEHKLPGLDFTPYQLFFISYAQGWCSKYTRQGALNQLDNKVWPPMNLRVEGVVMNSPAFAEAFNCKPAAPMNPVKKCSVW